MKVWVYVVIATGLLLLLQMAGVEVGGAGLLGLVGLGTQEAQVSTSSLFNFIFGEGIGLLIIGVTSGLVIGFFTRTSPENYILLPLITTVLTIFVSSFIAIMNYSLGNHPVWISSIVLLLMGSFTVGYILALVEFFRGTD